MTPFYRYWLFALALTLAAACRKPAPVFTPPPGTVHLPIEDRPSAPDSPAEGWCGESSVQMAALHFGLWFPQARINALGHPKTPDLWEHDVPTALDALGLRYETAPREDRLAFLRFVTHALQQGHPVVLGLKFRPTPHPEWDVDHLVLAIGFEPQGLELNTNMDEGRVLLPWSELLSLEGTSNYTLVNTSGHTWGFAVLGRAEGEASRAVVLDEPDDGGALTLERHHADGGVSRETVSAN